MKKLAQQIKDSKGDYSSLENSPLLSPKVLMSNFVDDLNNTVETKDEIKKRLDSFEQIKENIFLCARRFNKQCMGMECDCEIKDVPKGSKGCGDTCINRQLMMECPKTCAFGNLCSNKR